MAILGIIMQIEPMEPEKAYIIFGGLDIQPRVNMAISLARQNKLPPPLISRIVAMRRKIQGSGGLGERRNQVVHGAHRNMQGNETTLTMVRWSGDKRHKTINAAEIAGLGQDIHDLAMEAWSILAAILSWSVREHMQVHLNDAIS